jgi:hypothetical protein
MASTKPTPGLLWRLFVVGGVGTMAAVTVDDRAWEAFDDATGGTVERDVVTRLLGATLGLHAAESIFAYRSAKKAQLPRPAWWAVSTLIWGFPVLLRLRGARRAD